MTGEYLPARHEVHPGRIIQFLPVKEYAHHVGPELGWDKLATGGIKVHKLSVYPGGMLVEPFSQILAKELIACIDTALEITVGDER